MIKTIAVIEDLFISIQVDMALVKTKKHGWKTAAARARKNSLILEKMLKQFRKESVRAANE